MEKVWILSAIFILYFILFFGLFIYISRIRNEAGELIYSWRGRIFPGYNAETLEIILLVIFTVIVLFFSKIPVIAISFFILGAYIVLFPVEYEVREKGILWYGLNFRRWSEIVDYSLEGDSILLKEKSGRTFRLPMDKTGRALNLISENVGRQGYDAT